MINLPLLMKINLRGLVTFLILLLSTLFVVSAWVGDDTYITMRVVDNFIHGFGLRWNVDERVQVFTHPFWMLILLAGYVVTRHAFITIVVVSIGTALLSVVVFLLKVPRTIPAAITGTVLLALSKSFVDFSVSGLENPLTHLLLLLFLLIFFQYVDFSNRNIFLLSLLAGLATFNRMDTLLLFLPVLVYIFWMHRSFQTFSLVAAGFLPFLLWELFSLIYYGFLLPNTYYAKLNTGVAELALVNQGLLYFLNSLKWDTITLTVIGLSLVFSFTQGKAREKFIASGIVLYLAYILYIGGDFMSGRFFSAPYFASVFIFLRFLDNHKVGYTWIAAGAFLVIGLMVRLPTVVLPNETDMQQAIQDFEISGIADIKARAFQTSSLMAWRPGMEIFPTEKASRRGIRYREEGKKVAIEGTVGMVGFFGGPQLHIIDGYALGDSLLARLPVENAETWRPAHFSRRLPEGYIKTFETGQNQLTDLELSLYYDKLRLVISGDLWTLERWQAIWGLNMGQYDYLLENYVSSSN
jgi:arabinofuranosyltransferase